MRTMREVGSKPDRDDAAGDVWLQRLRPASELNRVRRGARIGVLLRDGSKVTGISQGSSLSTPEAQAAAYAEARGHGYPGPVPGDSLWFETVHGERVDGIFHGLAQRVMLVQGEGDSLPTPRAFDAITMLRCNAAAFDPVEAGHWIDDHPALDGRVLLLASQQLSAGRSVPGAIPVSAIQGFSELEFELTESMVTPWGVLGCLFLGAAPGLLWFAIVTNP